MEISVRGPRHDHGSDASRRLPDIFLDGHARVWLHREATTLFALPQLTSLIITMLKRQRCSSPPPFSDQHPSDYIDFDDSAINHALKRRRIVAPVLDGRLRGMVQEEEEEPDSDDMGEPSPPVEAFDVSSEGGADAMAMGDQERHYKAVNTLLHQLHQENRQRSQNRRSLSVDPSPSHGTVGQGLYNHQPEVAMKSYRADLFQATPCTAVSDQNPFSESMCCGYEERNKYVQDVLSIGIAKLDVSCVRFLGEVVRRRIEEREGQRRGSTS